MTHTIIFDIFENKISQIIGTSLAIEHKINLPYFLL